MTAFEDLKSQWNNQNQPEIPEDGAKKVVDKINAIRSKQRITNIVLGVTVMVLIVFFFYISAHKFPPVMIGLLIMMGSLLTRIGLEFYSMNYLKKMNVSVAYEAFKSQMATYYKQRIKVHFIATPLIVISYCIGFVLLLPAFKENLSSGFYNYILVSAVVVLVVLGLFIAKQVKKEIALLKEMKHSD